MYWCTLLKLAIYWTSFKCFNIKQGEKDQHLSFESVQVYLYRTGTTWDRLMWRLFCVGVDSAKAAVPCSLPGRPGVQRESPGDCPHRLQHWAHPPRCRGVRHLTQVRLNISWNGLFMRQTNISKRYISRPTYIVCTGRIIMARFYLCESHRVEC